MVNDLRLKLPTADPRLRRHINHDPESARYTLPTAGLSLVDVEWPMHIGVLNQGSTGKCTAESFAENIASDPFWSALPDDTHNALSTRVEAFTDQFYSSEETLDGDGPFPPNDNGSDGLTSAKVGVSAGLISGYQHTFTAEDALKGLQVSPASWGTLWKTGMDAVNTSTGQIKYTGTTRGGHQMCLYKVDVANERLWVRQSWGAWGYQSSGVCWISFTDFEASLAEQGDVTFFTPLSQPAPTPAPAPTQDPDVQALYDALTGAPDHWLASRRVAANRRAQTSIKQFFNGRGLST